MKKHSTKHILVVLACTSLLMFGNCSDSSEEPRPDTSTVLSDETRSVITQENAVYHQQTQSWIYHRNDPYTLENFRNAYDNLISNPSTRSLSATLTEELASLQIKATHYCIKIYPKTEKEQWNLEQMNDITVCYIPFDYVQLAESQTSNLSRSAARVFPEEARYTVVHEGYMTPEGPAEPETITMPVLYVVWPCTKQLPADVDYEILYEVFLPDTSSDDVSGNRRNTGSKTSAMQLLEEEALRIASGEPTLRGLPVYKFRIAKGNVHYEDNFMGKIVPIAHLKVRIQSGSKVTDLMTDYNGNYCDSKLSLINATIIFVFETENWKITEPGKSTPYCKTMLKPMDDDVDKDDNWLVRSTLPIYEIHRALNYFYYGHPYGETSIYYGGIRVIAEPSENADKNGQFVYSPYNSPYIRIYNNNRSNHNMLIGTVLHEIGHYQQYVLQGQKKFNQTHDLLIESYASYVGWLCGNNYYRSLGYGSGIFINNGIDLTGQARQNWDKTKTGTLQNYSPLFVDLVDDYNQNEKLDQLKNQDAIRSINEELIRKLARDCSDWASFKSVLHNPNVIHTPINAEDLADFIAPYDYFFTH